MRTRVPSHLESLTFSSTVYQRLQALRVLRIHEIHERRVDPSSRLNRVQAADDKVELHVVIVVFVLDLSIETAEISTTDATLELCFTHGVTFTPGTRAMMNSAATIALGFPTSFCLAKGINYYA